MGRFFHRAIESVSTAIIIVCGGAVYLLARGIERYNAMRRRQIIKHDYDGDEGAYERDQYRGDV